MSSAGRHRRPSRTSVTTRLATGAAGWPGAALLVVAAAVVGAVLRSDRLARASLDRGWLVDVVLALALLGLVAGVAGRGRRWWATWGLGMALAAAAVVGLVAWWLRASGTVAEPYPASFFLWAWGAVWATGVALTGWWDGGAGQRIARFLALPVILLAAFILIDSHYGYWPTVGALLGRPAPGQISRRQLHRELIAGGGSGSVGAYGPVRISGRSVRFDAGPAYVWLPPRFSRVPRNRLPVLVMLPGWPGTVRDWVRAGDVLQVADRWAAAHGGVAPVMVFVDENGAHGYDTECVNGPQGNATTYLTETVPHWIEHSLGIREAPRRWGVVGFSEGGTCAVDLGIDHPGVYGQFVDLAGDLAPNYGFEQSPHTTLVKLYGGDAAEMRADTPLLALAHRRFHHRSEAWFAAGTTDPRHLAVARQLAAAARRAGVRVHLASLPGGHTWIFAARAFAHLYPTVVRSLGGPAPLRTAVPSGGGLSAERPPDAQAKRPRA